MDMHFSRKWEDINDDEHAGAARLKIYGGWLVATWSNKGISEAVCFVPDTCHEWILEDKKE